MNECMEAKKLDDCRWREILKSAQGTTNVAIRIKEGIIVGVDSRSTNGEFITSEDKVKLFLISENMVYTTARSCYDCDRLTDHVEIKMKSAKDKPTISEAAKMVHEYLDSLSKDDVLC